MKLKIEITGQIDPDSLTKLQKHVDVLTSFFQSYKQIIEINKGVEK